MGWFWGESSGKNDPTETLSPDLKDFLKGQQPRPYVPAQAPPEPEELPKKPQVALPDTNKQYDDRPLPKESLYQDGRYKDLWKTFIPQDEITVATTTPVERIIAARKDRRTMIQMAAMENCAFENELMLNCLHAGDLAQRTKARLTMCRQETKSYNRCFHLQAKFLQALGYMTSTSTSAEDEERIQMHADKLYHRMMDYEAAVDEAKENKTPIPPLSSVFNPTRPAPTIEQLNLPKGMERKLKTPLHDLPAHERELAVRAALQEAKITHLYADEFKTYAVEMDEGRKSRQAWLIRTFGEPIGKFIVPDPPQQPEAKPYSMDELERKIWQDQNPGVEKKNAVPLSENAGRHG